MTTDTTLRAWLEAAPWTLCLSAGFFGFYAHCGMLSVLERERLLPARICGASAGGLVAGCWGGGVDAGELTRELLALRREDFWDPWPGAGLLRGRLFARLLERIVPADSFRECRAEVAVSVYDVLARRTRVLDQGRLRVAIRATAALPVLFQPVWLGRRPLLDGGILDRPGPRRAPPG